MKKKDDYYIKLQEITMVKAKVMKKKPKGTGRHQRKWETLGGEYAGWIKECEDGPEYLFCVPC